MNLNKSIGMAITGIVAMAMIGFVPVNAAEEVQGNTTLKNSQKDLMFL